MEESKRFYEVIWKPEYSQYEDVWITVKGNDYLIKVPIVVGKTMNYMLKFASIKISYRLKHQNSLVKQGRPRKYQYTTEQEQKHFSNETYMMKKRLLKASA